MTKLERVAILKAELKQLKKDTFKSGEARRVELKKSARGCGCRDFRYSKTFQRQAVRAHNASVKGVL